VDTSKIQEKEEGKKKKQAGTSSLASDVKRVMQDAAIEK